MPLLTKESPFTRAGIAVACGIAGAAHADIIQDLTSLSSHMSGAVFGQSFTAEGGEITAIGIGLNDANPTFGIFEITIDLHEGIGGALLDSQTLTFPDRYNSNWTDFDFSGNTLVADNTYSFIVRSASGRGHLYLNQHSFPDGSPISVDYAGGDLLENGIPNPILDMKFRVVQVPSPTSLSFIAGGLMLVTRRRRSAWAECRG